MPARLSPELCDLLVLSLVPGLGPRLTAALLRHFGSAGAVRRGARGPLCGGGGGGGGAGGGGEPVTAGAADRRQAERGFRGRAGRRGCRSRNRTARASRYH